METVSVQWLTQDKSLFELDWLKLMFSSTEHTLNVCYSISDVNTDSNTVLICNHAVPYRYVLDNLRRNSKKYVIVLLSDENLIEPCEWLHDPSCLGLLRNYINPMQLRNPKVKIFGLGYKRDFSKICKDTNDDKTYTWCFAGTTHGERSQMLDTFKNFGVSLVHTCSGFGASDALEVEKYAQMLKLSIFALCPPGQDSNDSFRLYEALEAGCIPVTLRKSNQFDIYPSYWHGVFIGAENIPFIIAESWDEALQKVKNLSSKEIKDIKNECEVFWREWKNKWKILCANEAYKLQTSFIHN